MTRYVVDSPASIVTFNARTSLHPVVARAPVTGWFEAQINNDEFAPGSTVGGELEILVDSIKSGNPLYDAETRRRINVRSHPRITAEVTKTNAVEGSAASVEGTVAFKGEMATLDGTLTLAPGPVLTGEGTVDIRWWGLQPPRLLAFRVEPEVLIRIELPLIAEG